MPGKLPSSSRWPVSRFMRNTRGWSPVYCMKAISWERRAEARGQHQLAPLAQQPHVGAVLVHHGEPLAALVLGAGLVDEDDLGVEVALLAGQALIDLVGDEMAEPAPIRLRRPRIAARPAGGPTARPTGGTRRPLGRPAPRPARPTTTAWALITRQSWKRGGALRSRGRSMKEARSSGSNRPERSRSAATTSDTSSANCASSPMNSGTAMGMGFRVPWVMSTSSGPLGAGRCGWALRRRRGPPRPGRGLLRLAGEGGQAKQQVRPAEGR